MTTGALTSSVSGGALAPALVRGEAAPKKLPALRVATVDDYPQIRWLESAHGLLTLEPAVWRAIWLDNPLWDRLGNSWPIGWVLEEASGEIVGSLGNIPSMYVMGGRQLVAAVGRAWVVTEKYRGIALWLIDEYFNHPAADLFLNTTVNSLAVDPFTAFGSLAVPMGDWKAAAFFISNYRGFAAAALRIKNFPLPELPSPFAAAVLKIKDVLASSRPALANDGLTIDQSGEFDSRFDSFWEELQRQNPAKMLGVRDRRTLTWHFAGSLKADHAWILTASRGGLMRAYAVLKRQDHPQSGLTRMRLVDYQTIEPDVDTLSPLIEVALRQCVRNKIHVMEHVGCNLPKMRSFDRYAPYRRKLPAWPFYYKATDPAIEQALRRPQAWDPSSYDGDASL
jgi:hypothetical protein